MRFPAKTRALAAPLAALALAAGLLAQQPSKPPAPRAAPTPAPATATAPAPHAAPQPARFVAVLDAAHGGDDAGAQLDGSTAEKTVTLALSVRLRSLLAARGVPVVTTREDNSTLDSDARAQTANHASAAACLSLHATESGTGIHIFTSSLMPAPPQRFLAWKTAQSAWVSRSLRLAAVVNSALQQSRQADSGDASAIPIALARTPLPGIDSMTCPAIAIEISPLRDANRKVTTEVTDPAYQSQILQALAAALLTWRTDWQTGAHQP